MEEPMILAIRIYYGTLFTPMADLVDIDGEVTTIQWTNVEQREKFKDRITGYTLIYDEREKRSWDEWLR